MISPLIKEGLITYKNLTKNYKLIRLTLTGRSYFFTENANIFHDCIVVPFAIKTFYKIIAFLQRH
jgi:hypothetical protein